MKFLKFLSLTISSHMVHVHVWFIHLYIGSNPVLGNALCVGSGLFYALTTVSEELLIKGELTIPEFLAFLGFSGAVVSSIQMLVC